MRILILTHALMDKAGQPVFGPADSLCEALKENKHTVHTIQHSLYSTEPTKLDKGAEGWEFTKKKLNRLQEYLFNRDYARKFNPSLIIAIDPLNGLSARHSGKKYIYYSVDYAIDRFKNPLLNHLYHQLDRASCSKAQEIWSISPTLMDLRKGQFPNIANRLMPNNVSNSLYQKYFSMEKNPNEIVIISHITQSLDFGRIMGDLERVKSKQPITLHVVGDGPLLQNFKEQASKKNIKVIFHGRKNHNETLEIVGRCAYGLAIYTDKDPWNKFRDSLKAREYLACGAFSIISDGVSPAKEFELSGAGIALAEKSHIFLPAFDVQKISAYREQTDKARILREIESESRAFQCA